MNKEVFELVKKESRYMSLLLIIILIIFKIVYFKESLIVLLRVVLSLFWLFAVPGYFIMLYWGEKLEFIERIIVGIGLAAAVIGIFSYYVGLIGAGIRYHTFLLPLTIIIIGFIIAVRKR